MIVVDNLAGGGTMLSKGAQISMCGNSVCPPMAQALVTANVAVQFTIRRAACGVRP